MEEEAQATRPIVIDLGKQKRKRVKKLRKGEGPLAAEVQETIAEAVRQMGDTATGKEVLPVVVLYERRPKKRSTVIPFFPFWLK